MLQSGEKVVISAAFSPRSADGRRQERLRLWFQTNLSGVDGALNR